MIRYANVADNVVIGVYEYASAVFDDSLVEIAADILVKRGDVYDSEAGEFITPEKAQTTEIKVAITSAKVAGTEQGDDYRLKVPVNAVTEFTIELQDAKGEVIAMDEHFALPLIGVIGQAGRTVGVDFQQGIAQLSISWPQSGEWQISEESLNMYVDPAQQKYTFSGLAVSVYE
ncbi:hypothetical protein [Thalassomonas haliotis]|uniref:Uncharacterized protein n=1 Tax=Thalassomonas haliotis TaxID=485448 RepID=A0ABY7VD75_9GAMM|nr:hypothetical protein [Thalassomonas haliotis]WDE11332.1 hypothetical protein H3N35_24440 [Thalassomonas haliotis]